MGLKEWPRFKPMIPHIAGRFFALRSVPRSATRFPHCNQASEGLARGDEIGAGLRGAEGTLQRLGTKLDGQDRIDPQCIHASEVLGARAAHRKDGNIFANVLGATRHPRRNLTFRRLSVN